MWVYVKGFEFTQFSTADDFNSQMPQPAMFPLALRKEHLPSRQKTVDP